jgi:hypothetical protein
MTPTHTSRNGKRYDYYVCRHTWKHASRQSQTVAAPAIERIVMTQLTRLDAWSAKKGSELLPSQRARLLRSIVERIDYDASRQEVSITFHSGVVDRRLQEPHP